MIVLQISEINPLTKSSLALFNKDIHHGNRTEEIFYTDPSVLYISLHRYDNGHFFPGTGGPKTVSSAKVCVWLIYM